MNKMQEQKKQRRQYLLKKGAVYISMKMAGFLMVLCAIEALMELIPALQIFSPIRRLDGIVYLVLALMFGGAYLLFARAKRWADKTLLQIPYVPPVTADNLPAAEVLVRGSEEPTGAVLLRGTDGSADAGEQELLRSSQRQDKR